MKHLIAQVNIQNSFFEHHEGANRLAQTPGSLVSGLLPNIMILSGIVFFFLILFGGFKIIMGAGHQSSPQDAAKARAALTYGVVGFLLVISAYFILQIISGITGINFLDRGAI
jgi:hypothetical protein